MGGWVVGRLPAKYNECMVQNSLDVLFGSRARVKLLKLFVFNQDQVYLVPDIAQRTQLKAPAVRKELTGLVKAGLVRKKAKGYSIRPDFSYLAEIHQLLIKSAAHDRDTVVARLNRTGRIKLVVVSGVFTQTWESRIDLLVVGDNIKQGLLEGAVRAIEAEVGKELRYAHLTTPDFKYRLGIYDRLVRDILDYPHQKIVNKIGV
jgi:predicted transcriptional regulator